MAPSWSELPQEVRNLVLRHMFTPYTLDLSSTASTNLYPWMDLELVNRRFRVEVQECIRHNGPKLLQVTGDRVQVFHFTRTKSLNRVKSIEWKEEVANFDQAVDLGNAKDMQDWLAAEVAVWAAFGSPMATGQASARIISRRVISSMNDSTGENEWEEEYEIVISVDF